jgi:hypothetical protein
MDRGFLKTVSVTQIEKTDDDCAMTYYDLQKDEEHLAKFDTVAV